MSDSLDLLASSASLNEEPLPLEEDEDDEEELSAAEVLGRLQTAWINEKFSPELLPPATEVVDCMMEQRSQMENNLAQVGKRDFRIPLHRMELARVKFMITSYHRLRLQKIQAWIHSLNLEQEGQALLTREELTFAKNYRATLTGHYKTLALSHMPGDFGTQFPGDKHKSEMPKPNPDATVFIRVDKPVSGVLLEDDTLQGKDEELDLDQGSQHILRFSSVKHLVHDGSVALI